MFTKFTNNELRVTSSALRIKLETIGYKEDVNIIGALLLALDKEVNRRRRAGEEVNMQSERRLR